MGPQAWPVGPRTGPEGPSEAPHPARKDIEGPWSHPQDPSETMVLPQGPVIGPQFFPMVNFSPFPTPALGNLMRPHQSHLSLKHLRVTTHVAQSA